LSRCSSGRHEFNKRSKSKELKPVGEVIAVIKHRRALRFPRTRMLNASINDRRTVVRPLQRARLASDADDNRMASCASPTALCRYGDVGFTSDLHSTMTQAEDRDMSVCAKRALQVLRWFRSCS